MSEEKEYETRIMRPAPVRASATSGKWKYWNNETGCVEFHDVEQTQNEKLRLIRAPEK